MQKPTLKGDILVVDDTPNNLRILSAMLEEQGYEVRNALSGKLALNAAHASPPDLILLDICMDELDGYEVCRQLKASGQTRGIPIIFLSALSDVLDKVKAFQFGGVDYITKPFQVEEVLMRVENQLMLRKLQKQLQEHNTTLEAQIRERTAQLHQALEYEALLKRITERVRDSLDEDQILMAVVQELTQGLGWKGCDAAEYDLATLETFTIRYECMADHVPNARGLTAELDLLPKVHEQILHGEHVQFCIAAPQAMIENLRRPYAILGCPFQDDRGVFGSIWVFKPQDEWFEEMEIRLVEQVANQCAIALRQARLYQTAQAQVKELERLNRLKDDFLSSVSHELRTPISNIKLATQMLEVILQPIGILDDKATKASVYFQILEDECQREISLITDLLDLTRLDARTEPLLLTSIDLVTWIKHFCTPFFSQIEDQYQTLQINLANNLPTITTDLNYLERVLTELLNNARKYTPATEKILVKVRPVPAAIEINVTNTGVEIPPEECDRIFDKFYRIPNNDPWKHGGTGLGLALVKKIVEVLQGSITVSSSKGKTSFILTLPLTLSHASL